MAPFSGSFEQGMEQIAQSAKKSGKQQVAATAQAVKWQVDPTQKSDTGPTAPNEQGMGGSQQAGSVVADQTQELEQAAKTAQQQPVSQGKKQSAFYQKQYQQQIQKGKSPEEAAKDAANQDRIRTELHRAYFEKLTTPQKPQVVVEEEKKQQEMAELQEEKEKKRLPPLPVIRKQRRIESLPGSG